MSKHTIQTFGDQFKSAEIHHSPDFLFTAGTDGASTCQIAERSGSVVAPSPTLAQALDAAAVAHGIFL
jgi:hypothetical protein